jgi:hypothetical protein
VLATAALGEGWGGAPIKCLWGRQVSECAQGKAAVVVAVLARMLLPAWSPRLGHLRQASLYLHQCFHAQNECMGLGLGCGGFLTCRTSDSLQWSAPGCAEVLPQESTPCQAGQTLLYGPTLTHLHQDCLMMYVCWCAVLSHGLCLKDPEKQGHAKVPCEL